MPHRKRSRPSFPAMGRLAPAPRGEPVPPRVAVVDEDAQRRAELRRLLEGQGFAVQEDARGGRTLRDARAIDAVCLDVCLDADFEGMDLLRRLRLADGDLPVVVVTADPSPRRAVEALRAGAYDYLDRAASSDRIVHAVRRACEHHELARQVHELTEAGPFASIVGDSAPMRELAQQVERVLQSDATVCLLGESGTGKELVARAIHELGHRREGPFVALNCAAIPTTLQESELFGHERGAFTGAQQARPGRFEEADGGTLFLDEIGEMDLETQAALLRTLQDKRVRRVGGSREVPIDVRILCATHRNLRELVRTGQFREDLYYRLVVYPIELPPLRRRRDDIPALVAHFIRELQDDIPRPVTSVSAEVLDALMQHRWPGNVRELRNVIHRAMLAARSDELQLRDLPSEVRSLLVASLPPQASHFPPPDDVDAEEDDEVLPLEEVERRAILKAMRVAEGRVAEAARMLGIARATLYRRLARLDIPVADPES